MHLNLARNTRVRAVLFSILFIIGFSTAFPIIPAPNLNFSIFKTVPGTSTLENISIRKSGDILVTSVSSNILYQIPRDSNKPPTPVATIPNALGLLGIVELDADIFYVIGSQISGLDVVSGSNVVWRVDLREPCSFANATDSVGGVVSLVAQVADAQLLNGMSRLSDSDRAHVLLADSMAGVVYRLNVHTGAYEIVIRDPSMDPQLDGLGLGINGIHVHGESLYFTNLDLSTFAKIPICLDTGLATGPANTIAGGIIAGDDFAIFQDGDKALIANNGRLTLTLVDIPGRSASVAANSTSLQACSAVAFGHADQGLVSVYVTSSTTSSDGSTVGSLVFAEFSGGDDRDASSLLL